METAATTETDERTPPTRNIRYRKPRRTIKLSLVQRLKRRQVYDNSDETEDGVETESDFFASCSFSEAGEDADVEDALNSSLHKVKARRKTSSSKICGDTNSGHASTSSEDDVVFNWDPLFPKITVSNYSQECIFYDTCIMLRDFNMNTSPFKKERFEDQGELADVEDYDERDLSDGERRWTSHTWRYLYRYWGDEF